MKLQDQCCTEQQAKRLHELGVMQSGYYCYAHRAVNSKPSFNGEMTEWEAEYADDAELVETSAAVWDGLPFACAFTVAELGVMLPHPDGMGELGGFNHPSDFDPTAKDGNPWYCMWEYNTEKYGMKRQLFEGATEAEARAAILIFFLEINLIQADEVNARLCAEM